MALDVIVIKDKKDDKYVASLKQFPGIIIQADNRDDINGKLRTAMNNFISMLQKQQSFRYSDTELT